MLTIVRELVKKYTGRKKHPKVRKPQKVKFALMPIMGIIVLLTACGYSIPQPTATVMAVIATTASTPTETAVYVVKQDWAWTDGPIPVMSIIAAELENQEIVWSTSPLVQLDSNSPPAQTVVEGIAPNGHAIKFEIQFEYDTVLRQIGATYIVMVSYENQYYLFPLLVVSGVGENTIIVDQVTVSRPLLWPSGDNLPQY